MKFFSVISVCKENLSELKKTYDSISNQTFTDFEWIVIDGDSKDGTKDWLRKTAVSNWISEPDLGIYDAMNKGIYKSTGKYLIFMNSGDCFESDTILEDYKSIIEQNDFPAFVYGDSIDIAENGSSFYRKAKNHNSNWKGMITQHQAMFFNKEKLGKLIYLEEYKLSGDYAFISSFINKRSKDDIIYLNRPICKFSMGGLNESKRFQALKEDYKIRKEIIKLPLYKNQILYLLHYFHAIIKKTTPSIRFIKHKTIN